MALNSSGPISLGGATVGQSINLELGQAATANTSLNATNVRTLLAVPSGQISLSNAYGKSNATAFIVSFGFTSMGTVGVNTVPSRGYGWDAAPSGVTAWKMGSDRYIGIMSADGTTFTNTQVSSSSFTCFFGPTTNKYTAGSIFTLATTTGSTYNQINYGSSNSYAQPLGTYFALNAPVGAPALASVIDTSGNVTTILNANEGKYGGYLNFLKATSSGSVITIRQPSIVSSLNYDRVRRILIRSDGSYVLAHSTSSGVFRWRIMSSDLNTNPSAWGFSASFGDLMGVDLDSNNNLFAYWQNGTVVKIDSSNTVVNAYTYSAVSNGYASSFGRQGVFGMSIYNNVMYIATNGIQDNASISTGFYLNIIAVSCSSMTTVLWNKQFYFNANEIRPFATYSESYNPGQGNGIHATSNGLYVAFTVGTGVSGEAFCMNLPLTVGISNQTTSIPFRAGGSVTMTVTTPSNSTNNVGLPSRSNFTLWSMLSTSQLTPAAPTSSAYSPGLGGLKTNVPV